MNTDKSRENNIKTPQVQNTQGFTKNLLRDSNTQLQNSQNRIRINGSESDKSQVRNPHAKTSNKRFKIEVSHTKTSQVIFNKSYSIRSTHNAQVDYSMTESLNKLKEIRTSR